MFKFEHPEQFVSYLESFVPSKYLDNGWGMALDRSFRDYVLGPRQRTHNTDQVFASYVGSMEVFDFIVDALKFEIDFFGYAEDVRLLRNRMKPMLPLTGW